MKRLFLCLVLILFGVLLSVSTFGAYDNIEIIAKNHVINFGDSTAKIELFDIEKPVIVIPVVGALQFPPRKGIVINTPIVSLETKDGTEKIRFKAAKVTLPVNGEANTIFKCENFDKAKLGCIGEWLKTSIEIEQGFDKIIDANGSTRFVSNNTISFDVNSFSAYGGGIIEIIKAEHLDSNRVFISNIFESVKKKDGNWSETIGVNEYVRVTFAEELDNKNDITVFARSTGTAAIQVYKKNGVELIATITGISTENWYRTLLPSLVGTESEFDLKIIGAPTEFDYIVDPTYDDFEDGTIDKWTATATTGGTMAASTSAKKFGSYGGRVTTDGANDTANIIYTNTDADSATFNLYWWIKSSDVGDTLFKCVPWNQANNNYVAQIGITLGALFYRDSTGEVSFTTVPQDDTWYRLRISHDGTKVNFYVYDSDNTLLESVLNKDPIGGTGLGKMTFEGFDYRGGVILIDIDNACYTDTDEPEPPPPPPSDYQVTLNLTTIGGVTYNSFPIYNYSLDGNKSIAFDIEDNNNSRLMIDLNYSSLPITGTGTEIVKDLNLTSAICPTQDWNGVTSTCSYTWNYYDIPDGNYAIVGRIHTFGEDENFDVSDGNVRFQSYVKLLVLPPIDEETLILLDFNTYSFRISYFDGNNIFNYPDLNHGIDLNIQLGLDYYVSISVDENTTNYYKRTYYLKYSDTTKFFDILQPYLTKKATAGGTGIQSVLFTRTENNIAIPNIEIRSYKTLPSTGKTLIEQIVTDAAGSATFSFIQNDSYTLDFVRDGNLFYTGVVLKPVYSSYQFYFAGTAFSVPDENALVFDVNFSPNTTSIDSNNMIDLNVSTNVQNATISKINILVYLDNNTLFDVNVIVDGFYDIPLISIVGAPSGSILNVEVILYTSTGLKISRSKAYSFNLSLQQSELNAFLASVPNLFNLGRHSEHKEITTLFAILCTIFIVGVINRRATVDLGGMAIMSLVILGVFTFLGFVYWPGFVVAALICFGLMIFARSY